MRDAKIIIVDDNEMVIKSLKSLLSHEYKSVLTLQYPLLLPALLRNGDVDIVLLDMNFASGKHDGGEGLFWLERIKEFDNPPSVILLTAFGDINLAVDSLKRGARDFIVKPWDNDKLIEKINNLLSDRRRERRSEAITLSESLINALLRRYSKDYAKPMPRLTADAFDKLSEMAGRGDLAMLQNVVEHTILLVDKSLLDADDFYLDDEDNVDHPMTLEEMEREFISEVIREKRGNLTLVAQQLDISRQTLYNKMRKYGL